LPPLLSRRIVSVNFGDVPFERRPPAGYIGFDTPDVDADAGPMSRASLYAPGELVAGESQQRWIQRYWEWVRSFLAGESPSGDTNGYRCGAGQWGPVWFVTGSTESARIVRECEVPAGKILLVPIVNTLAQLSPGASVPCDQVLAGLRRFSADVGGLRLRIDGVAVNDPQRLLRETGCFNLRDASRGGIGLAAGTGYWAFIKPLKHGTHKIDFGGTFRLDDFRQDIVYVLYVR